MRPIDTDALDALATACMMREEAKKIMDKEVKTYREKLAAMLDGVEMMETDKYRFYVDVNQKLSWDQDKLREFMTPSPDILVSPDAIKLSIAKKDFDAMPAATQNKLAGDGVVTFGKEHKTLKIEEKK